MPKLRPLSATEVARLLRAHGFAFVHQRGSHLIYRRQLPGGDSATVPVPNRRTTTVSSGRQVAADVRLRRSGSCIAVLRRGPRSAGILAGFW